MLNNKNCMILTFILHIHALIFNFWKNIEFFLLGPPMVYTIWGHLAQAYTFSTFFMETLSLHSHHTPRPRQCVGMLPSMFPQKLIESRVTQQNLSKFFSDCNQYRYFMRLPLLFLWNCFRTRYVDQKPFHPSRRKYSINKDVHQQ